MRPLLAPFPSVTAARRFQRALPYAATAYLVGLLAGVVVPWFGREGLTVGAVVGFTAGLGTFASISLWERRCRTRAEQHALSRHLTFTERRHLQAYTAAGELAPGDLHLAQEIHTRGRKAGSGVTLGTVALLILAGPLLGLLSPTPWGLLLPAVTLIGAGIVPVAVWLLREDAGTAQVNAILNTPTP